MNWYHRAERRYVEYGSSFEATRAFGLFRSLYDTVYNMNMAHLSDEVETVFETLGDHGVRTACTPFLIYRGRTRHEMGLEGLLRRVALAATFRHATWGPDELFYGELYSSRRVPCRPTLARPGTRDEYSACCGRELVADDLYDFLLVLASRQRLPLAQVRPRRPARVDRARRRGVRRARRRRRRPGALPGRSRRDRGRRPRPDRGRAPARARRGARLRVADPAAQSKRSGECRARRLPDLPRRRRLRALRRTPRRARPRRGPRDGCGTSRGSTCSPGSSTTEPRSCGAAPTARRRPASRPWSSARGRCCASGPAPRSRTGAAPAGGSRASPRRSRATVADGRFESTAYPDALARLWAALVAPHAGEILISAEPGYEFVDWGGVTHCPGGSHGSLDAGDSLGPLLLCGLEPGIETLREQWAIRDVAGLVLGHFGLERRARRASGPARRVRGSDRGRELSMSAPDRATPVRQPRPG